MIYAEEKVVEETALSRVRESYERLSDMQSKREKEMSEVRMRTEFLARELETLGEATASLSRLISAYDAPTPSYRIN